MLCKADVERFTSKPHPGGVYISPKLDGVRCIASVLPNGEVKYFSRNGKLFRNFYVFDQAIRRWFTQALKEPWYKPGMVVVFDGEVTALGGDFSKVMTQVHRVSQLNPEILRYNVFDIYTPENSMPFHERYDFLESSLHYLLDPQVTLVPHTYVESANLTVSYLEQTMQKAVQRGYEGIVVKDGNSPYVQKKSVDWLKMKPWETEDLVVIRALEGKGKFEGTMGKLACLYKGKEVMVGSGFTDEERAQFWKQLPKMIEVKYQEKTRAGSLRFPVFVRVREDKD
jgi:DNA ligase-1